jgi:hypothetical protein
MTHTRFGAHGDAMWRRLALLVVAVACGALACSDGGSADGGAGGGQGSAGTGGQETAGRGGTGGQGTAGRGGTGGQGTAGRGGGAGGVATVPPCPTASPRAGDSCGPFQACYYEDCAGAGRVIARCMTGQWTLETGACTDLRCGSGGPTCSAGEICVVRQGGAQFFNCVPNRCGTGAITCGCLQSCDGDCYLVGSLSDGIKVTCNICTQPTCA